MCFFCVCDRPVFVSFPGICEHLSHPLALGQPPVLASACSGLTKALELQCRHRTKQAKVDKTTKFPKLDLNFLQGLNDPTAMCNDVLWCLLLRPPDSQDSKTSGTQCQVLSLNTFFLYSSMWCRTSGWFCGSITVSGRRASLFNRWHAASWLHDKRIADDDCNTTATRNGRRDDGWSD